MDGSPPPVVDTLAIGRVQGAHPELGVRQPVLAPMARQLLDLSAHIQHRGGHIVRDHEERGRQVLDHVAQIRVRKLPAIRIVDGSSIGASG
jgi:hypothetical protein